ncbi:MAG: helix-turn-helix domain-containing protein [Steroidobacteraceae bacterium]
MVNVMKAQETAPKPGSMPYAARRIGVSTPTAYKLVREGKLRAAKCGRRTLVSDAAIADCLALLERDHPLRLPSQAA